MKQSHHKIKSILKLLACVQDLGYGIECVCDLVVPAGGALVPSAISLVASSPLHDPMTSETRWY